MSLERSVVMGLLAFQSFASTSALAGQPTLVPIGGDYETIDGFLAVAAGNAKGSSVDIAVLPTTYAEAKADAVDNGDYELAQSHVADLDAACEAIVDHARFPSGCTVTLIELWEGADASNPAIVAALSAPSLDSVFILGGDQGYAMQVLAGSPAEKAIGKVYSRGGVISGTSAGDSVLSTTMINGYTDYGDSSVALQFGALDVWFDQPAGHRGFSFGSKKAIFDQHLYERGRFGRLINEAARTADQYGHGGLLAFGIDTDTAPVVRDDRVVSSLFGPSSIAVVDFRSGGTRYAWVGSDGAPIPNPNPVDDQKAALSARGILVHLLAPHTSRGANALTFDLDTRWPTLDGRVHPFVPGAGLGCEGLTAERPLIIGGDLSVGPEWPTDSQVLRAFKARTSGAGPVILVAAGYDDAADAQADADSYIQALALSGYTGAVSTRIYPAIVTNAELAASAGVIILANDQGKLAALLADASFVKLVKAARSRAPVLMLERSAAALAGDVFDAIDDSSDWIEAFKASQAVVRPGLGLVRADRPIAFEPRLAYDYRHGRLFGIPNASASSRRPIVYGISEGSALVVTGSGAQVVGENPVFQVDTTNATFYAGDTGAIGVLNASVDVYEPSQRLGRRHRAPSAPSLLRRDRSDRTPALRK